MVTVQNLYFPDRDTHEALQLAYNILYENRSEIHPKIPYTKFIGMAEVSITENLW
jgi:hypothetical protein